MLRYVVVFMVVASAAFGQTISGVSGTISPGNTLTISGSSFGSGPTVVMFDDFEGGTNGSVIGAENAVVGSWDTVRGDGTSPGVYYSNSSSVSGSLSFRANEDAGANYIEENWGTTEYELFACWWIRHEGANWPGQPSTINWKTVWLWELELGQAGGNDLTLPSTVNGSTWFFHSNASQLPSTYGAFGSWGHDVWRRCAFWTSVDNASGVGDLEFWTVATGDTPWRKTIERLDTGIAVAGHGYRGIAFNGYGYNSSDSYPMFDDCYVAIGENSRARVEIGDNASYSLCTDLAILVPSSWSASSISVSMRETQFSSGASAYLFVTTGTGSTSAGYPITIDGESGNPSAPGRPQNMSAVER